MDFHFHANGVGFRKRGDWRNLVDIESCAISNPKLNLLLKEVREYFTKPDYFHLQKQTGTLKYAVIRTADVSSISFVLNMDSTTIESTSKDIEKFAKTSSANNIVITYVGKKQDVTISSEFYCVKGSDQLQTTYNNKVFKYSCQGFFQNNHNMALKMHNYVTELLKKEDTKNDFLLDLYGGVGAFGIMNAELFKEVLTVECVKECTDSANQNIKLNNITNVKAQTKDAKQVAKLDVKKPLTVITDPPRSGMHRKTVQWLNESGAKRIIYISCNPSQMGKELKQLSNYEIREAALCDLFPQTNHMEGVVELVLKKEVKE
jgi:23S rRNA (uracil-5-)-methyltransferase RumA